MFEQTLPEVDMSGLPPLEEVNSTVIQIPLVSKEHKQQKAKRYNEGCPYKLFFILKVSMFFLCFAGFIYQAGQIMQLYWKYPTVINFAVEKPEYIIKPAVTFCSSATIVRSKFCDTYPKRCRTVEVATEPICKNNADYCTGNGTHDRIPKSGEMFSQFRTKVVQKLMKNVKEVLQLPKSDNNMEGPFVYIEGVHSVPLFCYTFNSHVESGFEPSVIELSKKRSSRHLFKVYPSEVLHPWTKAGIYIHIHSPFMAVNPATDGIFMKPGYKYNVLAHLEEEHLLPPPYPTNCKNYSAVWEQNNRTGVRTQKMCVEKCKATFDLNCIQCVSRDNLYPSKQKCDFERALLTRYSECLKNKTNLRNETIDCLNSCRPDCVKLKYLYTTHEMNIESWHEVAKQSIEVNVHLEQKGVPVQMHKPQYQDVELFGYMGGFLGCWLGISLYTLADIIKSFYRSICRLYRKIEMKIVQLKHV